MNASQTAEPWEPISPGQADNLSDHNLQAEAVECFCGQSWYPDLEDNCPSCGREESEVDLPDEKYLAE